MIKNKKGGILSGIGFFILILFCLMMLFITIRSIPIDQTRQLFCELEFGEKSLHGFDDFPYCAVLEDNEAKRYYYTTEEFEERCEVPEIFEITKWKGVCK